MSDLHAELVQLRLVLVQKVREALEKAPTPALMDVARRLLENQLQAEPTRRAPPIVTDLPFGEDDP